MNLASVIVLAALYVVTYAAGYINGQVRELREHSRWLAESSKRMDELHASLVAMNKATP